MNVRPVLLPVDRTLSVKTPQDSTSANAPRVSRVLTPARKNAKISMSARRPFVTKMLPVKIPEGVIHVPVRSDTEAMASTNALKLMSAKLLLIRYC